MEWSKSPKIYSGLMKILSQKSTPSATCLSCPPRTGPCSTPASISVDHTAMRVSLGPCTMTSRCSLRFLIQKSSNSSKTVSAISTRQYIKLRIKWIKMLIQLIRFKREELFNNSWDGICQILSDCSKL